VGPLGTCIDYGGRDAIKRLAELVPVAHTCNPSYSGGRDLDLLIKRLLWVEGSQELLVMTIRE
jgi:hypothetical protein